MAECERPAAHMQEADRILPELSPRVGSNAPLFDSRSTSAMEELASLMLEMDIEEKGEPSFTIAAGKRNSSQIVDTTLSPQSLNKCMQALSIPLPAKELLDHLMDCFGREFNGFHQFLDCREADILREHGADVNGLDSQFRNAALLAVAACFSTREDAVHIGAEYASLAESLPLRCIKEQPSDIVVQGLTLLAWKELMFGIPSMAYNYICTASLFQNVDHLTYRSQRWRQDMCYILVFT